VVLAFLLNTILSEGREYANITCWSDGNSYEPFAPKNCLMHMVATLEIFILDHPFMCVLEYHTKQIILLNIFYITGVLCMPLHSSWWYHYIPC
jgi:hypothetical protein